MLNSAEHKILDAHKYKKYQEIQLFSGSDKFKILYFLLIKVKMPTIVGILTFLSRKNLMLSRVEHEIFYNLGTRFFVKTETEIRHKNMGKTYLVIWP